MYGIASLLNVGWLTLQQRRRALAFVMTHRPPKHLLQRAEQAARCLELALELSELRWSVLRYATGLVFLGMLKMMAVATLVIAANAEEMQRLLGRLPMMRDAVEHLRSSGWHIV